jgi:hypothetical protein
VPFIPWAWLVSKILDKHAARFFLARDTWNMVHLVAGLVAVLAAISIPLKSEGAFWIGWGIMIVILVVDVVVFVAVTNKDERVPAEFRLRLSLDSFRQAGRRDIARSSAVELIQRPDRAWSSAQRRDARVRHARGLRGHVHQGPDRPRRPDRHRPGGKDNMY